ncbi:MAG: hypothetical protein K2M06_03335 [Muribaculaceae bacterium]|nr:hypothetical protein [Muribaculaceae bacterium]
MQAYFVHKKYLTELRLTPAAELDRLETRLAFYSQPQLARFFEPMARVREFIRWKNESALPQEAREFSLALDSVERGATDNRDLLLHALAQLVAAGNMLMILNATRRPFIQSFMAFARLGVFAAGDAKAEFGGGFQAQTGLLALGRLSGGDTPPVFVLPDPVRQALGIKTGDDAPSAARGVADAGRVETPLPGAAKPLADRLVMMAPAGLPRSWALGRFMVEHSRQLGASEVKRFASMTALPSIAGVEGSGGYKPVMPAKVFLTATGIALRGEKLCRKGREPFPQVLRCFIGAFDDEGSCFELVSECARHLSGSLYSVSRTGITRFFGLVLGRLRMLGMDSWHEVDNILEAVERQEPGLRVVSGSGPSMFNTLRTNRNDFYGRSRLDERTDVRRPYMGALLTALALLGIVDLALGPEPAPGKRFSQYDSVREVRLTPLGAYALGLSDKAPEGMADYEIPSCRLDEEYPFIYVPEDLAALYEPYLRKVGKPIGSTRYAVSAETFMEGITTRSSLEERIEQFRAFVGYELPDVWNALIDRIKRRAYSIHGGITTYYSLKIDRDNDELIDFVAHNELINEVCVRGEGGLLFIPAPQLEAVLAQFTLAGFLPR